MKRGRDMNHEIRYEFHKWKKQLVIADIIISIVIFALLAIFRPDLLLLVSFFLIFIYLFLTARKNATYHLLVSSIIAFLWVIIARDYYGYNKDMIVLFGINLFPLFAWASGLFMIYIIYSHWEHILKYGGFFKKILLFSAFYIPLLLIGETIAYHLFGIHNIATGMYVGLPLCNCIHAPIWMQISYILMGPIYFIICDFIGLENPHHIKIEK